MIRKAVFPVAGLGTRFLPATKASPKEMLAVVDKPLIQYVVEEAVTAGIKELIFVTGRTKRAIEDHFDKSYELEMELRKYNKQRMLDIVQNIIPDDVACINVRQAEPLGLGHAILCARTVVGDEPFAVLLADNLINNKNGSCMEQMVKIFDKHQSSVIAVKNVTMDKVSDYGVVRVDKINEQIGNITGIVEKPAPNKAPSTQAIVGRYILVPEIFELLAATDADRRGEVQLTDAIAGLLTKARILACQFTGEWYDCGSKLGYLRAIVEHTLQHEALKDEFRAYLNTIR